MDDDHQQEEFLLKWNDHHNSFFSIVQDLCASELLTDVTLACGAGEPIIFEAHKLMLSVCSTFFRNILTRKSKVTDEEIFYKCKCRDLVTDISKIRGIGGKLLL